MKIIILTKLASTRREGFHSRIAFLAEQFVLNGCNVDTITSDSNHLGYYPPIIKKRKFDRYDLDGVHYTVLKTLKYSKTVSVKRVLSWIDFELKLFNYIRQNITYYPDVIIVSSLSLFTICNGVYLKRKYPETKFIFEVRDIWPLTLIEEGNYSRYNPAVLLMSYIEKLGYKRCDSIVGTMPNLSEHVKNIMGKDYSKEVYTVPFGYNSKDYVLYEGSKPEFLESLQGQNKYCLRVGYAGSIGLSNGLGNLISVIEELGEHSNIQFVFLGEGAYLEEYKSRLQSFPNVTFYGRIPRKSVKHVLNVCDLLFFAALPSKVWDYGWSLNKMIDYMASGKPVLCEYSGYRSMISEANSGFFVPSGDRSILLSKLVEISLMDKTELEQIGHRGIKWLEQNRTWDKLAKTYLNIFKN